MSTNEPFPEKTLFGTNFDSNKLLTKVDYTDFYNGKWNKNKEALKQGKILSKLCMRQHKHTLPVIFVLDC